LQLGFELRDPLFHRLEFFHNRRRDGLIDGGYIRSGRPDTAGTGSLLSVQWETQKRSGEKNECRAPGGFRCGIPDFKCFQIHGHKFPNSCLLEAMDNLARLASQSLGTTLD
jgi:hypothetical protein